MTYHVHEHHGHCVPDEEQRLIQSSDTMDKTEKMTKSKIRCILYFDCFALRSHSHSDFNVFYVDNDIMT